MPTATLPRVASPLLTAKEFARRPEPLDGSREELVRGVIEQMPMPRFRHGEIQSNIACVLKLFVRPRGLGRVATETGVPTESAPDTVRGPDVAYWSVERMALDAEIEGYPDTAPDLCVEVLSESDRPARIRKKLKEYFACGVRMVWVVDPEARTVTIYRRADKGRVLREDETLTGEEVIPRFECGVSEFFAH